MGRNKSETFVANDKSFYQAGKKHFDVYVGNQISGIYDKRIPASEKLFNTIKGYLAMDPHMLVARYNLFNLIGKKVFYTKYYSRTDIPINIANDYEAIFAILSDTDHTPDGMRVCALFYVEDFRDAIDSFSFDEKPKIVVKDGSADVLWLLNFFKAHAKTIPATKDEISKLKEVVMKYAK